MAYDLHIHSNCSRHVRHIALSPENIAKYAKEVCLEGFALTDHDTREGVDRARRAAEEAGLDFIPGIEMSFCHYVNPNFKITGDILGYFIDPDFPLLKQIERGGEDSRKKRDSGIRKALNIPKEELREGYTREDLADKVVEEGLVKNRTEAYSKLLKPAGKGLVEREKTPLNEVLNIIIASGGVPICAHLGMMIRDYNLWPSSAFKNLTLKENLPESYDAERDFETTLLPALLKFGIRGFEIYPYNLVGKGVSHGEHAFFNDYANKLNQKYKLIDDLRGSDDHFQRDILTEMGCFVTSSSVVDQLKKEHLKIQKLYK